MRYADFGVLHRNELSGALTGLTRVRRFQQDDAHIFCMVSQIKAEVAGVLDMISTVYKYFGMTFALKLSTRPENALGDMAVWDMAEEYMTEALNDFKAKTGHSWSLNPATAPSMAPRSTWPRLQAAAPVRDRPARLRPADALRPHLPAAAQGGRRRQRGRGGGLSERPVMIHRAVLGSVERMIAILTEHYAGKWPFFPCRARHGSQEQAVRGGQAVEVQRRSARRASLSTRSSRGAHSTRWCARRSSRRPTTFWSSAARRRRTRRSTCARDNAVHGVKSVDEMTADFRRMADEHTLDVNLEVAKASQRAARWRARTPTLNGW